MKKILGLDLGTNSIGWAVVNADDDLNKVTSIEAAGSRIIPMMPMKLMRLIVVSRRSQNALLGLIIGVFAG